MMFEEFSLNAQLEFENTGSCKQLSLCSKNTANKNAETFCRLLDTCDSANCDKIGTIKCDVAFNEIELNFGQDVSFSIKTLGHDDSEVISDTFVERIELDRIKDNHFLTHHELESKIEIRLGKESLPAGFHDLIEINCLNIERSSLANSTYFPCDLTQSVCACDNLMSGSIYNVSIRTRKYDDTWFPQTVHLKKTFITSNVLFII